MKNSLKICLAILFAALIIGCKKRELQLSYDQLNQGSYLTFLRKTKLSIDPDHKATDKASIKVGYVGLPVSKIKLYVMKDGSRDSIHLWKPIKTVNYTEGGTVLEVTAQEIAAALGITLDDILPGDTYSIFNEIETTTGEKFNSHTTKVEDFSVAPAYNMAMEWNIVLACPVTQELIETMFNGEFEVIQDDWDDYNPGSLISVKPGPGPMQFSLTMYPAPFPSSGGGSLGIGRKDIVVTVEDDGLTVEIKKNEDGTAQLYGGYTYPGDDDEYWGIGGKGIVSTCEGKAKIRIEAFHFFEGKGTAYGPYPFELLQHY